MDKIFTMSRYGRGDDYLNCPMNKDEYDGVRTRLQTAETVPVKGFEESAVFEGCMPVESMAKRGDQAHRLRAAEARGAFGSAHGRTPLCRGAAAAG